MTAAGSKYTSMSGVKRLVRSSLTIVARHINLSSGSAKRRWKYVRSHCSEDAVKIGRARTKRDQREHVEAAMHDGLPAPDKERQSAPQDHWGRKSELDPGPHFCREHVLHGH